MLLQTLFPPNKFLLFVLIVYVKRNEVITKHLLLLLFLTTMKTHFMIKMIQHV